jgi:hypothetical protein
LSRVDQYRWARRRPQCQFIDAYFAADQKDSEAVGQCFTENAIVKDEGKNHIGIAAIKKWKAETAKKSTYTCEPFESTSVITSHLVGNFPGSSVDLRYIFSIEGEKIAALEIICGTTQGSDT